MTCGEKRDFEGKVGLITGAGKFTGIGFGLADKLASMGAHVVLTDLGAPPPEGSPIKMGSLDEMKRMAGDLKTRHNVDVLALEMDVCDTGSINAAFETVERTFGGLDFLFNNAGTAAGAPQFTHDYDEAGWVKTFDVNCHGVFRVSRAAVKLMRGRPGAAIVNVASRAGKAPAKMNGAYSASKAAVIMITKVMAVELGAEVRVNAICPGLIKTDLQEGNVALKAIVMNTTVEEAEKTMVGLVPLGRMGTINEVADTAVYLVSPQSSYITGQAVNVGGGYLVEL